MNNAPKITKKLKRNQEKGKTQSNFSYSAFFLVNIPKVWQGRNGTKILYHS